MRPGQQSVDGENGRRYRRFLLGAIMILFLAAGGAPEARAQDVPTSQYDNARTGANLQETTLTPANVNVGHFGKLFAFKVDGAIYAQPLYMRNIQIPGKGRHNIVFVATEHDSVYAFDAEGNPREPLWKTSLLDPRAGAEPVPGRDTGCFFIEPEVGITSTPAIDLKTGTIYVLARTREKDGLLSSKYVQRLHALAITTGAEKFGGPVVIAGVVQGRGDGHSGGHIDFDNLTENPRASLLVANGKVYLTWASSCDVRPYHGWVMAYDAHTLRQLATFNTTPDAGDGGIWAGDTGPAADGAGDVYAATGNGGFTAAAGGRDYGDTVLKLDGSTLRAKDYFTPFNESELNITDKDLGSGGPVLLPDQPGAHRHLLVIAGKGATLYLVDRDRMGRFHQGHDSEIVQEVRLQGPFFGAAAYWNHHVYVVPSNDVIRDFDLDKGILKPAGEGKREFGDPGATPSISADGAKNGIVWLQTSKHWSKPDGPHAVLYAYDASDVSRELYNSEQDAIRDRAGVGLRFNIPMIANSRVYVAAEGELDVYGLK